MKKNMVLHTDGGSRGNPGPAGLGAVLFDEMGTVVAEVSKYLGVETNNVAEYKGVLAGLEMVLRQLGKEKCKQLSLVVRMDSELICKQLNNEYQIKEPTLFPLYIAIHNLHISTFPFVRFEYVPRAQNAYADRLANKAMDAAL